MRNTFVQAVCKSILAALPNSELRHASIIVPSQRIALHIKKELTKQINEVIWLPKITTIASFLEKHFDRRILDPISVQFELYTAYFNVFDNPDSFDTFQSWSNQIINDFNDIDKYLLDEKQVFINLKSIKEIENWSFNTDLLSDTQQKFLQFWEKLGELYTLFYNGLKQRNLSTVSNMYRCIAENPYIYFKDKNIGKYIYFAGFNALSKSEEVIIKYFVNSGLGKVFWDADEYYVSSPQQEAGHFIRSYQKWAPIENDFKHDSLKSNEKRIITYGARSNLDQTNIASKILDENPAFTTTKSALVFADESLLRPMLNNLPDSVRQLNVAMGYPLTNSFSFGLLDQLFTTLKNRKRYHNKKYLYYKDFQAIFKHELIVHYLQNKNCSLTHFYDQMVAQNYTYIPITSIEEQLKEEAGLFNFLFAESTTTTTQILQSIIELFRAIRAILLKHPIDDIEIEAAFKIIKDLILVKSYLSDNDNPMIIRTIEGLKTITSTILRNEHISFFGEPMNGLQVLGLLETRGLDFENIILLSCNDNFLPRTTFSDSLMPHDLRHYFGLPGRSDRDAIFAYYFYRLLQRSKHIHLLYNNGVSDKLNTNEISRYILQIEKELGTSSSAVSITRKQFNFTRNKVGQEITIKKDNKTLKRLDTLIQKGLSASSINTYYQCPKDFYFTYVLRLKEQDGMEENIEASTYGSIIHKVLEELYGNHLPIITTHAINVMLKEYKTILENTFLEYFPGGNFKEGRNYLNYKMADYTIKSFLKKDREFIENHGAIKIISLEKEYSTELKIPTPDGPKNVKFKGNIDRIDQVGDRIRIIDYKTGIVKDSDLLIDINDPVKKAKAFQLLLYQYLFFKSTGNKTLSAGIISLKRMKNWVKELRLDKKTPLNQFTPEILKSIEGQLNQFVQELYDTDQEFMHDALSKYCKMC